MPNRRAFLVQIGACLVPAIGRLVRPALAQGAPPAASAFVKGVGDKLVAVVMGTQSSREKRANLTTIIDHAVDVDGVAQFCSASRARWLPSRARVDAFAGAVLVGVAGHETLLGQLPEVGLPAPRDRQGEVELGDHLAPHGEIRPSAPAGFGRGAGQPGGDVGPFGRELRRAARRRRRSRRRGGRRRVPARAASRARSRYR